MIVFNENDKFLKFYELLKLMRINNLIGFFLLLWPTLWALWLSNQKAPCAYVLILFIIGVFLTRSFGCIINDCVDRDIDCFVKRTENRPLSRGVVSVREALGLFFMLVVMSFVVMIMLSFTMETILLSFVTFLLICLYPYTKRYIFFPQLFLGVVFGCSVLIVFSVLGLSLYHNVLPWLLFLINVIWVMIYDTEYAMVDRDDDLFLGIQSSAIFLGHYERIFIGVLQLIMLILFVVVGLIVGLGTFFYISLFGVGILFLWQQILIYFQNKEGCFRAFLINNYVGFLIFCGIFIDISVF